MKCNLATLAGIGACTLMSACGPSEVHRGIIVSETYEKRMESYVLNVSHGGTTNNFIVLKHIGYSPSLESLAGLLKKGDSIAFRYINLNRRGIGHIYAHQINKISSAETDTSAREGLP